MLLPKTVFRTINWGRQMQDEEFEWDDEKAEKNAAKHSIYFDSVRKVFEDPDAKWLDDTDSSWGEDRYRIVGLAGHRVIFISYTYRSERIRLISVRVATKRERNDYYRGKSAS